jgi:hypothetical protein
MSKIFVVSFLISLFTYQIQETEQNDTSVVAAPATLKAPVLSTVFEMSRWSIHSYGSMMANLLYFKTRFGQY